MLLSESKHGDSYGVSHNDHAILVSVNGERAALTPDECEAFMRELVFHLNEHRNGLWCGTTTLPVRLRRPERETSYAGE